MDGVPQCLQPMKMRKRALSEPQIRSIGFDEISPTPKRSRIAVKQMQLTDLIDDCLLEVFKLMTIPNLMNVAEASKSFVKAARDAFQSKYGNKVVVVSNSYSFQTKSLKSVALLKRFGDLMTKLVVNYSYAIHRFDLPLEMAISKHCAQSLTEITLNGMGDDGFYETEQPFEKVTKVCIRDGFGVLLLEDLFPNVQSLDLVNLKLGTGENTGFIMKNFPSLTHLGLIFTKDTRAMYFSVQHLKTFIRSNPQLISLKLKHNPDNALEISTINIDRALLAFINQQLPQLQALSLDLSDDDRAYDDISSHYFGNLKSLSIKFGFHTRQWRISGEQLENLTIKIQPSILNVYRDKVIKTITLNSNISKLGFFGGFAGSFPFERVLKALPKLEELKVSKICTVDLDQVRRISKICGRLTKLSCWYPAKEFFEEFLPKQDDDNASNWSTKLIKLRGGAWVVFEKK